MDNGYVKRIAAGCIIKNNNEYLFIKRNKKKLNKEDHGGLYIPIGGKVKPYESPRDATVREVYEETGIKLKNISLKGIITETSPRDDYNWIVYFYYSEMPVGELLETDEGTLEWIREEDFMNLKVPEIDEFMKEPFLNNKFFVISGIYDENIDLISAYDEVNDEVLK